MNRENKVRTNFTFSPRWIHYLSQISAMEQRSNSNMIEILVEREFERMKSIGIKFSPYPGDQEILGSGKDDSLQEKYNQFVSGKK